MAESLEDLNKKRGIIKSKLMRFKTFVTTESNQSNYGEIEARLEALSNVLDEFESIESAIQSLSGTKYESQLQTFENDYFGAIGKAKSLLSNQASNNSARNSSIGNNVRQLQEQNHPNFSVKLPTIKLPDFDGEPYNWLTFHDTFKALIDEDSRLSNVQKLFYLKACMKGEASNLIKDAENTLEGYKIAWDLLKNRFDNNRIIIQQHVQNILDLPPMNRESAPNLRSLIDKLETNLRSLKALGEKVDDWDTLIIHLMINKLDYQTHKDWEKSLQGTKMPSLKEFKGFLNEKCRVLESLTWNHNSNFNPSTNKTNSKPNN